MLVGLLTVLQWDHIQIISTSSSHYYLYPDLLLESSNTSQRVPDDTCKQSMLERKDNDILDWRSTQDTQIFYY